MSKLIDDFKILREHCIKLRIDYNTYNHLLANKDLLSKIACIFFDDIIDILHRYCKLQACPIMDPATTTIKGEKHENITLCLINMQLEKEGLLTPEIEKITKSLLNYGEKIKPARNKILAHFDRESCVKEAILGGTSEEELKEFFKGIQEYCDLVGNAIGTGPLDFSSAPGTGDVKDFISFLKSAIKAREA